MLPNWEPLEKKLETLAPVNTGWWGRYKQWRVDYLIGRREYAYTAFSAQDSLRKIEQAGRLIFNGESEEHSAHTRRLDHMLRIGQQIEMKAKLYVKNSSGWVKKSYVDFLRAWVGFQYRYDYYQTTTEPDAALLAQLNDHACRWKGRQLLAQSNTLTDLEVKMIREMAKYREWVLFLLNNPQDLDRAFKWCLRDSNSVRLLVLYPDFVERCLKAHLSGNFGYLSSAKLLKEEELDSDSPRCKQRVITLPFYTGSYQRFEKEKQRRVNILNPKQPVLFERSARFYTIEKIFKTFEDRNLRMEEFVISPWGVVPFDSVKGDWDQPTGEYRIPEGADWIHHIPPAKICSTEELREHYPTEDWSTRKCFFQIAASCSKNTLQALGCHAYLIVYLRIEGDQWKVLNIGSYAYRFPQGPWDAFKMMGGTFPGVTSLADPSAYITIRQQSASPLFPNNDEEVKAFAALRRNLDQPYPFQFAGKNCAYWVSSIIKEGFKNAPNYFLSKTVDCSLGWAPIDRLFVWLRRHPVRVHLLFIQALHILIGSFRKMRLGNVVDSTQAFFKLNGASLYNPALLPYQISRKKLAGKNMWGSTYTAGVKCVS